MAQPVLQQPPVERVRVDTWEQIEQQEGLAPWLVADDRVVLGSRPYGQGQVVVLAALRPLSNEGLAEPASAALALNLVGGLPSGTRIAFDEYHHGFVQGVARSLWQLLREHYWGWAIIYSVALGYLFLAARPRLGRRWSRRLPRDAQWANTSPRWARCTAAPGSAPTPADRIADQLKRDLATALGLNARLSDEAFAQAAADRRRIAPGPLANTLARLRAGGRLAERDLLALVRERTR